MFIIKRIILSFLLVAFAPIVCNADSIASPSPSTVADSSEDQLRYTYDGADFRKSIELLEAKSAELKAKGEESASVYYNMGNAYYRMNELGNARLYYERALLLAPGDKDIRHNIAFLTTKIEDKIPVADTFFISIWLEGLQSLYTSNGWAVFAIITFLLLIVSLMAFFITRTVVVKKVAFYAGLLFVTCTIVGNIFSFNQKGHIENRNTAVIMAGVASIYSSPDSNGKSIFTLHAGTKVDVTKVDRSWLEIELDDGSVGWVQRENVEII